MQIKDVMSRNVAVIHPEASLADCARKMRDHDVGSLPVCDGRRLSGMITDRDIAIRAVAEGRDPGRTRVRDACTERVVYCHENDELRDVAQAMKRLQVRRMPVLSRDDRLVGMIALKDIAESDRQLSTEVLDGVSEHQHFTELQRRGGEEAIDQREIGRDRSYRAHENGR